MTGSSLTSEDIRRLEAAFSKVVTEETGLPVQVRIETVFSGRQELLAFLDNGDELTEEQHDRLLSIYSLEEGMYDSNGRHAYRILLEKAISRDLLTLDFVHDIEQKLEEEKAQFVPYYLIKLSGVRPVSGSVLVEATNEEEALGGRGPCI